MIHLSLVFSYSIHYHSLSYHLYSFSIQFSISTRYVLSIYSVIHSPLTMNASKLLFLLMNINMNTLNSQCEYSSFVSLIQYAANENTHSPPSPVARDGRASFVERRLVPSLSHALKSKPIRSRHQAATNTRRYIVYMYAYV